MIATLVLIRYIEGEDVTDHLKKMNGFKQDLSLMGWLLTDNLFATFLHISMPPIWNYTFAGLPKKYTTKDVQHCILDEWRIHINQQTSTSMAAYNTSSSRVNKLKTEHPHRPGELYCNNCKRLEYWIVGCWPKGGGA